jgi:hypothetical protein
MNGSGTVMFCCVINRILEISSVVFEYVGQYYYMLECWPSDVIYPARRFVSYILLVQLRAV